MEYALLKRATTVEQPFGPYLADTKEKSPMTFMHRRRQLVIWGAAFFLLLRRWWVGTLASDVRDLLWQIGDWRIPLWLASIVFVVSFECAMVAINTRVSRRAALLVHFALQAALAITVTAVLMLYNVRLLSSLVLASFWAMMSMKTHSYVAFYRITNHAIAGLADFTVARVSPWTLSPEHSQLARAKRAVSFTQFIAFPCFVYDPYALRLRAPRYAAAVSELAACVGTVLLLHLVHIEVVFPLLFQKPAMTLTNFLNNPLVLLVRFVKVAPCIHAVFFLVFYAVWHCAATFMADMTAYAERTRFYGPFWRTPMLGHYFRLWSAIVHTWLRRHCLDDVLQLPVLPLRGPLAGAPRTDTFPTEPSTPVRTIPAVGEEPPAKRAREQGSRTARVLAAVCAFAVSAVIHELVFVMTAHVFTSLSFAGALFVLGLYTWMERRMGQVLPWFGLTFAIFLGHAILYVQLAHAVTGGRAL